MVLLTQELDKLTGLEVAQMLATRKQHKQIGFILLSSNDLPKNEIIPANLALMKKEKNFSAELDRVLRFLVR